VYLHNYLAFVSLYVALTCSDAANLPPAELEALQDLYLATDGDNWDCENRAGHPWVFSEAANPCEDDWVGIECSYDTTHELYHVANLTLGVCFLVGTIPPSIRSLSKITELALYDNNLHGPIPDIFGDMRGLTQINLGSNILDGSLPPSMALLGNITSISLSYNQLIGRVHVAFDSSVQTQLHTIDLSYNAFSGQLPDVMFGNSALVSLDISSNCFSGALPEAICSAAGAGFLVLSCLACSPRCTTSLVKGGSIIVSNPIQGTIPPCVFNMPKLLALDLSYNYLTGPLPVKMSSQLWYVSLSSNALTGTIPTSLWSNFNRIPCLALIIIASRGISLHLQLSSTPSTTPPSSSITIAYPGGLLALAGRKAVMFIS
jgi:hypothetical protein